MCIGNTFCIICRSIFFLPNLIRYKIIFPEHLITQEFEICLFVIVDGDEDHSAVGEEVFGEFKAFCHEGEPVGVAERGVFRDGDAVGEFGRETFVTVAETIRAGVVRRVDVDDVHLAAVRVVQARQRVVVLPFDQNMARFAVVGADLFFGDFFKNRDPVFTLLFKFFRNIEPDQTVTLFRELGTQMRVFFCQFNEFFS